MPSLTEPLSPRFEDALRLACDLHRDNARCILADYRVLRESLWDRFSGGRDGTLRFYRELVRTFSEHGEHPLVQELERVVGELDRIAGGIEST
ncbi:MAG TPA: hypothetical protein PKZ76_00975 [Xanthomonadaceae bacterium]|nr:hypothetical protein [Xanthomonadaceae bacterium]